MSQSQGESTVNHHSIHAHPGSSSAASTAPISLTHTPEPTALDTPAMKRLLMSSRVIPHYPVPPQRPAAISSTPHPLLKESLLTGLTQKQEEELRARSRMTHESRMFSLLNAVDPQPAYMYLQFDWIMPDLEDPGLRRSPVLRPMLIQTLKLIKKTHLQVDRVFDENKLQGLVKAICSSRRRKSGAGLYQSLRKLRNEIVGAQNAKKNLVMTVSDIKKLLEIISFILPEDFKKYYVT